MSPYKHIVESHNDVTVQSLCECAKQARFLTKIIGSSMLPPPIEGSEWGGGWGGMAPPL